MGGVASAVHASPSYVHVQFTMFTVLGIPRNSYCIDEDLSLAEKRLLLDTES